MDLEREGLVLEVPVGEKLGCGRIDFLVRHLEGNRFVGLGSYEDVLVILVRRLDALLVGRHEAVTRLQALLDLGIVYQEQQRALVGLGVALLCHAVAWSPDLGYFALRLRVRLCRARVEALLLERILGQAALNVLLVTLALGMRKVVALVGVNRKTQLALVRPEVVAHKVRVLVQVHRLQGELAQALATHLVILRLRRLPPRPGLAAPPHHVRIREPHPAGRTGCPDWSRPFHTPCTGPALLPPESHPPAAIFFSTRHRTEQVCEYRALGGGASLRPGADKVVTEAEMNDDKVVTEAEMNLCKGEHQDTHGDIPSERPGWSRTFGLGLPEERALAMCASLHERLGRESPCFGLDAELLRAILTEADARDPVTVETEPPDAGCTLYGCMFDVRNSRTDCDFAISALSVFSSTARSARSRGEASYQVYRKQGSCWANNRDPWIAVASAARTPAQGVARPRGCEEHVCFRQNTLTLLDPIVVPSKGVTAIYVHSEASWGAVGYKTIEMVSPMAVPGAVTAERDGLQIQTGTFGMSPDAFSDISDYRCAFSGTLEADALSPRTRMSVLGAHPWDDIDNKVEVTDG